MKKLCNFLLLVVCLIVYSGQPVFATDIESKSENPYSLYDKNNIKYPTLIITDINDTLIKSWNSNYELITRCLDRLDRLKEPRMSLKEINAAPLIHPVDLIWSKTKKNLATIEKIYEEESVALSKESLPPRSVNGAGELIEYLKSKHIPIIVVSNDEKKILLKNLDKLGWTSSFKAIFTKDNTPNGIGKPNPKAVEYAIQHADLKEKNYDSASIWFLGDSYGDMKCASGANIVPIWIKDNATAKFTPTSDGIKIIITENLHEVMTLLHKLEPKPVHKNPKGQ